MSSVWMDYTSDEVLNWLTEEDEKNAPVRYLALKDLLDAQSGDKALLNAKKQMMTSGPVAAILTRQTDKGFWDREDSIYYNKYTGTIWQIILLSQMGVDRSDARVEKGCEYTLTHGLGEHGGFSMNGRQSGTAHCIQGNLAAALIDLGYKADPRVQQALGWMARSVTGEGFEGKGENESGDIYLRSGISGPGFLCSSNNHEACAWGVVKVGLALTKISERDRTSDINQAIELCTNFLTSIDPVTAEYPHPYGGKPSSSWFKFGFPVFYITDLLQVLEVLVSLGLRIDQRLEKAVTLVLNKRDERLRWPMEYSYNGKTWVDIEEKGKPSKWVTLRALRMLKGYFS